MTLEFKIRHSNGNLLQDLTLVYVITVGKIELTSVSASVYYFRSFV